MKLRIWAEMSLKKKQKIFCSFILPALCLPLWSYGARTADLKVIHISMQQEVRNILPPGEDQWEKLIDSQLMSQFNHVYLPIRQLQLHWLPSSRSWDGQVPRSVRPRLLSKVEGTSLVIRHNIILAFILWVMGTSRQASLHFLCCSTLLFPILILNPAVMYKVPGLSSGKIIAILSICALVLLACFPFSLQDW